VYLPVFIENRLARLPKISPMKPSLRAVYPRVFVMFFGGVTLVAMAYI
jgi:hypothetical protein